MTSVAILGGTGQQGRALAQRLQHAGLRVTIGSRDPGRARAAVAAWIALAPAVEVADNAAAVAQADVTMLAVPFTFVDPLLEELRPHFKVGSLVVDLIVPVTFAGGKIAMVEVAEGSAAEHVRARLPASVRLDCDEFVCGDSDAARAEAVALVALLPGLRPVDVGALSRARSIEHLTALAIAINRRYKIHDARFRVVGLT
jgi:predicted dinucleotide-binding enzyme